jgi:hypothetical protein
MSLVFERPDPLNTTFLVEELEDAGYQGISFFIQDEDADGNREWGVNALTATGEPIDERSRNAIQAVFDAHTGAPPPEVQTAMEADQQMQNLRAKALAVYRGEDQFTALQRDRILAAIVLKLTKRQ